MHAFAVWAQWLRHSLAADSDLVFVDGDAAAEAFEDFEDLKEVDLRKEESTQVWHLDILFDAINVTLYTIWK